MRAQGLREMKFSELPNPVYNADDETVQTANALFVGCMCFVLFHEYHHFNLRHIEQVSKKSDEYDADYNAFYSMYADQPLDIRKAPLWLLSLLWVLC